MTYNDWAREVAETIAKMIEETINGERRQAGSKTHGDPPDGAGNGAGAAAARLSFPNPKFTTIFAQDHSHYRTKPDSGAYAGIRTGEVIAWRCWWVFVKERRKAVFQPLDPDSVRLWPALSIGSVVKEEIKKVPLLCSIAHEHYWNPGDVETGDVDKWISAIYEHIPGGVYAWKSLEGCLSRVSTMCVNMALVRGRGVLFPLARWEPYGNAAGVAYGTVKMWGDVVEHEDGWRSTHAKVSSIKRVMAEDYDRIEVSADQMQKIYGVGSDPPYFGAPWT